MAGEELTLGTLVKNLANFFFILFEYRLDICLPLYNGNYNEVKFYIS